jgi:hypothetical protein
MTQLADSFPVVVVGAAAVSAAGLEWRGMARALRACTAAPSQQLALIGKQIPSHEVPPIPRAEDAGEPRSRKLMSRAARLAAVAARKALLDAGWVGGREQIGFFLGLGESNGPLPELRDILCASMTDGRFDTRRLARDGLSAANPLFAFHLLNNFNLCHGAIAEGLGGPNGAFYSRGAGTALALIEAAQALADGDCDRVLAGGADSALYPGTWHELEREGFADRGLVPGEGATLLALARTADRPLAVIEGCAAKPGRGHSLHEAAGQLVAALPLSSVDAVVLAGWGPPARDELEDVARLRAPGARTIDVSAHLGDALAATPALGWAVALDLITCGEARRSLVLSAGVDGDVTGAILALPEAVG